MCRPALTLLLASLSLAVASPCVRAEGLVRSTTRFYYQPQGGKMTSAPILRRYHGRITYYRVRPDAPVDRRIDPNLRRAVSIAEERAHARTQARCWKHVKEALLAAGAINSYPSTAYAAQAGDELVRKYGFKRLPMRDPYAAPVGAVIVYGKGAGGAGHVELRTKNGFVSDYRSPWRCYYPVLAIYGKFSS